MALRLQKTEQIKSDAAASSTDRRQELARISRLAWAGAALFVALLILVTLAFQLAERDQIRSGVTAFGVDLGGMTPEEARAALADARDERSQQPITLTDGEREWQVSQRELGLRMNVDQTVEDAFQTGRSGFGGSRLAILWHLDDDPHQVGHEHIAISGDSLQAKLSELAGQINQPTIEAQLAVHPDGAYDYVHSQIGRELDVDRTQSSIVAALATGRSEVALSINEFPPAASDADYAEARQRVENVLNSPITVQAADEQWTFQPHHLAPRLQIAPPEGEQPAALQVDENWFSQVVAEIEYAVDRLPQSPRVWWNGNGDLIVTEEPQNGASLDAEQASSLLRDAFLGVSAGDTVEIPVTTMPAPPVPEDLASLGLTGVIAESSTPYGDSIPERKHNIEYAAELLNGTLVMPGETFSFNGEIGPMTMEAGFQEAYGITKVGDRLQTVSTVAGGICQVATTVFQPVFTTGYQIDQRSTHSYWIPDYTYNGMVGLDATVHPASGLDLKWTNDSSHAVLVQATADGENFTVRLIGQPPGWEVEIPETEMTDIVEAEHDRTYYRPDTSMPVGNEIRVERARNGFDVRLLRIVRDGDEERVFDVATTYEPSRNVVAVGSEDGDLPPGYQEVTS